MYVCKINLPRTRHLASRRPSDRKPVLLKGNASKSVTGNKKDVEPMDALLQYGTLAPENTTMTLSG